MSSAVPKGWQLTPLSDHASRIRSKNVIGNTNVLTASAVDGLINQRDYFNKSVASTDISHYTLLRKGDFAYNKSYSHGYPVGVVRRLKRYDFGVLSPLYICFSIDSDECDETYLSYYFDSHRFERELNSVVQEGARAHGLLNIPVNDFFDRELLLPPLPEQKKIASILTSVDEVIENTQKQIDKLQDLKKASMNELLTTGIGHTEFKDSELGRIPKSWEVLPLGQLASVQTGIAKNSKPIEDSIAVPYLRVANVQDGYLDLTEMKTIEIPKSKFNRYLLQNGDVLMNEGGDFDKLGRGTVWRGEITGCVHQNHVFAVRPDQTVLTPEYLKFVAGSEYGKGYFINNSKQSTNLASINSTQLKEMPIPLASLGEQESIVMNLKSIESFVEIRQKKLSQTQSLKKSLMQDLLTGKVRVKVN